MCLFPAYCVAHCASCRPIIILSCCTAHLQGKTNVTNFISFNDNMSATNAVNPLLTDASVKRPLLAYRPHNTRQLTLTVTLTLNPNLSLLLHRNYVIRNRKLTYSKSRQILQEVTNTVCFKRWQTDCDVRPINQLLSQGNHMLSYTYAFTIHWSLVKCGKQNS